MSVASYELKGRGRQIFCTEIKTNQNKTAVRNKIPLPVSDRRGILLSIRQYVSLLTFLAFAGRSAGHSNPVETSSDKNSDEMCHKCGAPRNEALPDYYCGSPPATEFPSD